MAPPTTSGTIPPSTTASASPSKQPSPKPFTVVGSTPTRRPTNQSLPQTRRPTRTRTPQPTPRPTTKKHLPPKSRPSKRKKVVIKPTDDTFIDGSHRLKNYDSRGVLHVRRKRGSRESLLKFDISALLNKCVKSATLSLYSLRDTRRGGFIKTLVPRTSRNSFARATRWKEHEATWSSIKQNLVQDKKLKNLGRVNQDSWVDTDVTAGIKNDSYVTFCIASKRGDAEYASKERRKYSPKLTIMLC